MISVCMPTYNGEKYVRQQIDSILQQLSDNDELIISDDSSTDNTLDIIEKIKDSRIILLRNNHFGSATYNIENALSHAKGDYIFLSDQDDIWVPEKVEIMKKHLEKYDCVVSDAVIVDQELNVISGSFFDIRHSGKGLIKNIWKNSYMGCCMAINRRILDIALPFPNNIPMHDCWIGLLSEEYGKTCFIKDKLILHRRHGDNASDTAGKSRFSLGEKVYHRYSIIMNIIKRKKLLK